MRTYYHLMKTLMRTLTKSLRRILKSKNVTILRYMMMKTCCSLKKSHYKNLRNNCFSKEQNSFPSFCKNLSWNDLPEHNILKMMHFSFEYPNLKNYLCNYLRNSDNNHYLREFLQNLNYYNSCCY
jgi:hypothetical protein